MKEVDILADVADAYDNCDAKISAETPDGNIKRLVICPLREKCALAAMRALGYNAGVQSGFCPCETESK